MASFPLVCVWVWERVKGYYHYVEVLREWPAYERLLSSHSGAIDSVFWWDRCERRIWCQFKLWVCDHRDAFNPLSLQRSVLPHKDSQLQNQHFAIYVPSQRFWFWHFDACASEHNILLDWWCWKDQCVCVKTLRYESWVYRSFWS